MVGDAVGDAEGLLLAIDRLGRTIVALERQNAELAEQNRALTVQLAHLQAPEGGPGQEVRPTP